MTNIYRIQVYNWIMCVYFRIGFIDFMLKGKSLLVYRNLFSPNDYEKNVKRILKYFQSKKVEKYIQRYFQEKQKIGKPKISYHLEKTLVL